MKTLIILILSALAVFQYVNRGSDADYQAGFANTKAKIMGLIQDVQKPEKREALLGDIQSKLSGITESVSNQDSEGIAKSAKEGFEASLGREKTTDQINWNNSFSGALAEAKRVNKPIMIDFYASWCGWCKKLDKTTFQDAEIVNTLNNRFVTVKIDGDKYPDLVKKYQVQGYPTILFLDSLDNTIVKQPGYLSPQQFSSIMSDVLAKI